MNEQGMDGSCRSCRFWNGNGSRPAPCFKIRGKPGRFSEIPANGAAFYESAPDRPGSFLMTGPYFSCLHYQPGRPRFYGDDGSEPEA